MKEMSMTTSGLMRRGVLVASFAALLACPPPAGADKKPVFDRVAIVPFTVELQTFEATPNRSDQDDEIRRLQEEAGKQVERSLKEHGLAGEMEPAAKAEAAHAPFVLTGVIRLTVSLPPRIRGVDAYRRSGPFVTVTETLQRSDGTVISTGHSSLGWSACWWVSGGKTSRNIPVDTVLSDFVRKGVDRAARNVFQEAAKAPHR